MDVYLSEAVGPFHVVSGIPFASFTTKKDISPSPLDLPTIPGQKLRRGSKIAIKANGRYSALSAATLQLGFWHGTQAGGIAGDVAISSVITLGTTPAAWPWWMEWEGLCIGTGTAGSLLGQGQLQLGASLTTFNAEVPIPITEALCTVGSFDTTIARAIGVSAAWGASSGSNTLYVMSHRLMIWN